MRAGEGALPNLVVIGAPKCGTSALHYYLGLHPEITMSRHKELNFFIQEKNWPRGVDWYRSHFARSGRILGESSPGYACHPLYGGVPERMHSLIPDAKLIYMVRDPVQRTLSHYVMGVSNGRITASLTEMLRDQPDDRIFQQSRYFMQLQRYLEHFSAAQILIVSQDDLLEKRRPTLQRVFRFLAVDPEFSSPLFARRINRTSRYRKRNRVGQWLSGLPMAGWIDALPSGPKSWASAAYYLPFSSPVARPVLNDAQRENLENFFREDVDRLRKFAGRDFKEWCV